MRAFLWNEQKFQLYAYLQLVSLSFFANLGSLVGLAATLWTAWSAYRSKRYYLLVGRVPDQIQTLRRSTIRLAVANNPPNWNRSEILSALKKVRVAAESIRRNVSWRDRGDFGILVKRIREIEQSDSFEPTVIDEVWAEGEALADRAEAIVKDRKFSRGS